MWTTAWQANPSIQHSVQPGWWHNVSENGIFLRRHLVLLRKLFKNLHCKHLCVAQCLSDARPICATVPREAPTAVHHVVRQPRPGQFLGRRAMSQTHHPSESLAIACDLCGNISMSSVLRMNGYDFAPWREAMTATAGGGTTWWGRHRCSEPTSGNSSGSSASWWAGTRHGHRRRVRWWPCHGRGGR